MAEGLNKVILIGNLGADPELRFTQGGQPVLSLRLATTSSYPNKAGERQERTEWHTVVVWGARAEALHKILAKGRSIGVEGRIQYRSWDDKEGHKRNATDIVANNILLLGGSGGAGGAGASGGYGRGAGGERSSYGGGGEPGGAPEGAGGSDFPADDFGDDNIPF